MLPLSSENHVPLSPLRDGRPDAANFLNYLRFTALACRVKPRTNLFQACALLHVNKSRSLEAHAEALMRCLNDAVGKNLHFHAPGTAETSFDEAWLVQLGKAISRHDDASTLFLLRSRVLPEHRRLVGFLVRRISEFFDLV